MERDVRNASGSKAKEPIYPNPGQTVMKTVATMINILAFAALFFDYAIAMQPPQPAGTRRFLQIYAGQLPTGAFPTLKPVWEPGIGWRERA